MSQGITVDFNANIARFTSALDKATNDLSKFQSNAERVSGNINKAFGALGVGLSVAGLTAFVKGAIDAADHLNDLSASTSLTVTQLSGLQLAARKTGTDLDGIATSVNKLSVNMGKDAAKFAEIGITAKDPIKAFQQLADVFVGIEDPQKRAAVAAAALGKQWAVAAPLLAQGGIAIGEMVQKGIDLSGSMEGMAAGANDFNDKLDEMHQKMQGMMANALTPLLPMMKDAADYMSNTGDKAKAAGENMSALTIAFQAIAVVGANVGYTFDVLGMHLVRIVAQANALAHGDFKGFTEIGKAVGDGIKDAEAKLHAFEQKILHPESSKPGAKPTGVKTSNTKLDDFIGGTGQAKIDPNDTAVAALQAELFRKQMELMGVSAEQVKVYELAMKGATASQLRMAQASADALAPLIAQIEAQKELNAAKDETAKFIDKVNTAAKEEIAQMKFDTSLLGQNAIEVQKRTEARRIDLALEKELLALRSNEKYKTRDSNASVGQEFNAAVDAAKRAAAATKEGALAEIEARNAVARSWDFGVKNSMTIYIDEVTNAAKQSERLMTNAFKGMEDALVQFVRHGKLDFSSLADSILNDLIRIQIQQSITGPLAGAVKDAGGFGGMVKSLFGFADGGIMTSAGPLPLNAYAGGGIASTPQLALFGEGRMPEAFVPLPDGRRIPVAMQGGAGGVTVNSNLTINAPNASAETVSQIRAMMPAFIAENQRVVVGAVNQALVSRGQPPIRA